jgi:hypothetical protein
MAVPVSRQLAVNKTVEQKMRTRRDVAPRRRRDAPVEVCMAWILKMKSNTCGSNKCATLANTLFTLMPPSSLLVHRALKCVSLAQLFIF